MTDIAPDLTTATRLLEEALHLRMNGERAPGGNETWRNWERSAEEFLRSLLPPEEPVWPEGMYAP